MYKTDSCWSCDVIVNLLGIIKYHLHGTPGQIDHTLSIVTINGVLALLDGLSDGSMLSSVI